ncbi:thiol reductant ABC exporter subunit CydC [Alicyclobacillus mali (ex Roth et al. 2021)]|uniref:thiol reductant ABC exporter subunit CydC n=1 Tax=Alicyclobacillus mali (ex Roth et al. 2021) TaxID=1123961 RepID=UPI000A958EC7|nr:thiol reductant ABC exporter subunit CydC [Alicyclobacillus mali (ex Roth et al. 2021)]
MRRVRWMWGFVRPVVGRVAGSTGLSSATFVAAAAMMATAGYLISAAALKPSTILMLWVPIVGVRFFGTSRAAFRYLERLISHDTVLRLTARLRAIVFSHLERHPDSLIGRRTVSTLDLILTDMERVQNGLLRLLLPLGSGLASSALVGAWLARMDLSLAVTFALGVLVAGIGAPLLALLISNRWHSSRFAIRQRREAGMDDLVRGIEELLAHGEIDEMLARLDSWEEEEERLTAHLDAVRAILDGALYVGATATVAVVLAEAIELHLMSHLPGTMIAAVTLMVMAAMEPWTTVGPAFADAFEVSRSVAKMADLAPVSSGEVGPQAESEGASATLPLALASTHTAFSTRGLSCRRGDVWALRDVDIEVPRGHRVAIVGDSGAGKSTLLHVALGLVAYDEGEVRWFGHPLVGLAEAELRRLVTAVPQDTYIFHTTLRQNLLLARPDATDEELMTALSIAQLEDLVSRLPKGLDTVLHDRGYSLSGGERQRLSLARAVLSGAEVVLCDEPTSSLDVETERSFMEAFFTALRDKTVVWVTHRLTGMEYMDQIFVLHEGRVVERGTHRELVYRGGVYSELWSIQREVGSSVLTNGVFGESV